MLLGFGLTTFIAQVIKWVTVSVIFYPFQKLHLRLLHVEDGEAKLWKVLKKSDALYSYCELYL